MTRFVALLRGINVGGRNKVAMSHLRDIAVSLGYAEVRTYIQSGNLVFSGPDHEPGEIAHLLRKAIAARVGIDCQVVVLNREDLGRVIEHNPFPQVTDPRHLHAVLRPDDPDVAALEAIEKARQAARDLGSVDEAKVIGRTLYLSTPGGIGRSELAAQLQRTSTGPVGTARNWRTLTTLLAMLEDQPR